jgi:group I intron endonuclease
MMDGKIYKATNIINGKIYIGQTVQKLEARINRHIRDSKSSSIMYFHRALIKYGQDKFTWEIIDNAKTINELNQKEVYWINYYNSNNEEYGYNCNSGGGNAIPNDKTKERLSIAWKNSEKQKLHLEEMREKARFYHKGLKHSEETKRKISNSEKLLHLYNHSKINPEIVIKIKTDLKNGIKQKEIAVKYGISIKTVSHIKNGYRWGHISI